MNENYSQIGDICSALREDYPNLSDYEILNLSIQLQRNEILIAGLGVNSSDRVPAFLEATAIQLGYKTHGQTLLDVLDGISAQLRNIT